MSSAQHPLGLRRGSPHSSPGATAWEGSPGHAAPAGAPDSVGHPVGPHAPHHAQLLQGRLVLPLLGEDLLLRGLRLHKLLPALGRALDVAVQVLERIHVGEDLRAGGRWAVPAPGLGAGGLWGGDRPLQVSLSRSSGAAGSLRAALHPCPCMHPSASCQGPAGPRAGTTAPKYLTK